MIHPTTIIKNFISKVLNMLNSAYYSTVYFPLGGIVFEKPVFVDFGAIIHVSENAKTKLGKNVRISGKIYNYGSLEIGENTTLCHNTEIGVYEGGKLVIGKHCGFSGSRITCAGKTTIGSFSRFARNSIVYDYNNHSPDFKKKKKAMFSRGPGVIDAPENISEVLIGDNCWICQNAAVLKGSQIADNSILAVNSVALKKFPKNSLVAGNPAKVKKMYKR